ncbi:MAG: tetratricopeptide repeat protein [Candidatus Thorarchaeota archaeon]
MALSFISRGNLTKAEYLLKKAIESYPEHGLAWAYLGRIREKEGSLTVAEEIFSKVRSIDPEIDLDTISLNPKVTSFVKQKSSSQKGVTQSICNAYQKPTGNFGIDQFSLILREMLSLNFDEAEKKIREAIKNTSNIPTLWILLGDVVFLQGHNESGITLLSVTKKAIAAYEEAEKHNPGKVIPLVPVSSRFQYSDSISKLNRIGILTLLTVGRNVYSVMTERFNQILHIHTFQERLSALIQSLQADSIQWEKWKEIGDILLLFNEYPTAAEAYAEALFLEPDDTEIQWKFIRCLRFQTPKLKPRVTATFGRGAIKEESMYPFKDAGTLLNQIISIEIAFNDPELYYESSFAFEKPPLEFDDSLRIQKIIKEGDSLRISGDKMKAKECYQRAFDLDNKNLRARIKLASLLMTTGRYVEALITLEGNPLLKMYERTEKKLDRKKDPSSERGNPDYYI